jgi:hypothetical protein
MDSNARSTTWHDHITNHRGRILEEFLVSVQLHILNEDSNLTTYLSRRGSSNIDLTVTSNSILRAVEDWEVSNQQSCSDHSFIKFAIRQDIYRRSKQNNHEVRYIIRREDLAKFQENLTTLLNEKHGTSNHEGETEDLDLQMSNKVRECKDIEQTIDDFHEAMKTACENTFRRSQASGNTTTNRSIPWWTGELTVMRKRTNAFRRRFQRRRRSESLREQRKTRYLEEKARYEATIKSEKLRSWKAYCNVTTSSNPWNEVYKIAAGKTRTYTPLTTLQRPDGSLTQDLTETLQLMLEHFTPEDNEDDDTDHHKTARALARETVDTPDDKYFTVEETISVITSMDNQKAPGIDGISGEVYKSVFEIFPKYLTAMYNSCLNRGIFPRRWKAAKMIPIVKPGKENCDDASKFRHISLINVGGKVLEKLLINRINHQIYSHVLMSGNHTASCPQKSTTDAAITVKGFVEKALAANDIVALISLDVKVAFDAAWWPSILNGLKNYNCSKNLFKLSKSYFIDRSAIISSSNIVLHKTVTKGGPTGILLRSGVLEYPVQLTLQHPIYETH